MKITHRNILGAPPPLGPYSLSVQSMGALLFVSGLLPWDPKTQGIQRGSISEQTRLVLENLKRVVEGSGGELKNTLSCRVYLSHLNSENFQEMNAVYAEYFTGEHPPARATIGAQLLGCDVEIECVVALDVD